MATKRTATKPTAVKSSMTKSAVGKPAAADSAADDVERSRPALFSRSVALPAAGVGLVTLILAVQEDASFPIAIVVGVAVTLVVIGMIALKRAFYGD